MNMAKEKNGGQVWMRNEELPKEEEIEMAYEEPQHEEARKEVPKHNEKRRNREARNPSNRKKM